MQGSCCAANRSARTRRRWSRCVATLFVCTFVSFKLFRWEKEEKLKPSAKLWVVAALLPFLVAGVWQAHDRGNLKKAEILARAGRRAESS